MTIVVHQADDSAEARAAGLLGQLVESCLKNEKSEIDEGLAIYLIPNAQCFGSGTRDVDVVAIMRDLRDEPFSSDGRNIRSLCLTIEVKDQGPSEVHFEGNRCYVNYHGRDHDVTSQSEKQKYSFRDYISQNLGHEDTPWVINLIWLRNVTTTHLPRTQHNIIGSDVDWQQLLDQAVQSYRRSGVDEVDVFGSKDSPYRVSKLLTQRLQPTEMDRRKIENVTRRVFRGEGVQWEDKFGEQLLIFRGRGGTGKTVRLLSLANELYTHQGSRVLLLTYNNALVADLSRLTTLMGLQGGLGDRAVKIKSIYSFMASWLKAFGVMKHGSDFLENYDQWKDEALELLQGGAIERDDVREAITKNSDELAWDYIMIDESQDWPENERDILYRLYDFKKFIIADGVDQLVRSQHQIDWRHGLDRSQTQVVPLRKSLRLKENICHFVQKFSSVLEYDWDVDPEPNSYGGHIIVVVGGAGPDRRFHEQIFERVRVEKNELIDMLFCVPPSWVKSSQDTAHRSSRIGDLFATWGYQPWDAVDSLIRREFPQNINQPRVVQYDSCRGLEGWAVFNYAIDEFFEYKRESFVDQSTQEDFLDNPESRALLFAKRWMMIPLTRAIDTLVLHVESKESYIGRALDSMRDDESIQWIE